MYTPLHDFTGGSAGAGPLGNLVFDANGNLYGTAYADGDPAGFNGDDYGCGVIWEITP